MERINPHERGQPWWIYVLGLSYILTFGIFIYLTIWGPAEFLGFVATFSGDAMLIHSVEENSQVAKAGLRAGDRVLVIDDLPIRNVRDWTGAPGNSWLSRPQRWLVSRDGNRLTLQVVPVRISVPARLATGYLQVLSLALTGLFLALLIAWKRPNDPVARIGAWFVITASIAAGFPPGWAVIWRAFPPVLQLFLWIPQISRFVLEGICLSFFVVFPRRLITRRWLWLAIWVPVLITLPWRIAAFDAVIHPAPVSQATVWILQAGFVRTMLYLLTGIVVLAVSYRRFLDPNEKRRVRILILGTAVSLIAATITVWLDSFSGRMTGVWNVFVYVVVPLYSACPISLAYAILRHRVLDISVIIRQGLQYAFARGGVIGFVPALGVLFILDLTANREQRVAEVFQSRGWIYLAAAVLSLVAYWKRSEWLESIDRRFFRERYNAQQVLREVVKEIRATGDFESAAARVVERIETALHPEFVSVLVRLPGEQPEYRPVATMPRGQRPPELTADSKVVALLHVLGKPVEFLLGDSDWLDKRLPHAESEFIRSARIDLLVPIATGPAQTEALMALGVKRSEEPYTREDQELLEMIASSLAHLLDETARRVVRPAVPRMRVGRYRLERRLGEGGMGTVYEAMDTTLERRVAIKLIRDDWVDSTAALQRFRREARAAAGFTHPNVVTIFDYGVEAEARAFLVMELLEGSTLREELTRQKRLEPSRIVHIFRGVCGAVEAAHQRDLIHRDLKPENIFIANSAGATRDVIKVLDFGIAKFLPAHDGSSPTRVTVATHTGMLIGTPAYMSPEQLLGEGLEVGWDLWALSVVVYEILTGALPFAASRGDGRKPVLSGDFTPLREHFDNPPERWLSFFARCFAVDRAARPRSAAELLYHIELAFL